jgi:hypothetical protein
MSTFKPNKPYLTRLSTEDIAVEESFDPARAKQLAQLRELADFHEPRLAARLQRAFLEYDAKRRGPRPRRAI